MYYTYIAHCADDTLYTGYCKNIQERENKHNQGTGAKYTRGRTPLKIVYFEEFLNKCDAMKREAQIKKLTKPQKHKLIEN